MTGQDLTQLRLARRQRCVTPPGQCAPVTAAAARQRCDALAASSPASCSGTNRERWQDTDRRGAPSDHRWATGGYCGPATKPPNQTTFLVSWIVEWKGIKINVFKNRPPKIHLFYYFLTKINILDISHKFTSLKTIVQSTIINFWISKVPHPPLQVARFWVTREP